MAGLGLGLGLGKIEEGRGGRRAEEGPKRGGGERDREERKRKKRRKRERGVNSELIPNQSNNVPLYLAVKSPQDAYKMHTYLFRSY
jgi:hypothetical protein